jgi:hypothetical protein
LPATVECQAVGGVPHYHHGIHNIEYRLPHLPPQQADHYCSLLQNQAGLHGVNKDKMKPSDARVLPSDSPRYRGSIEYNRILPDVRTAPNGQHSNIQEKTQTVAEA